MCGVHGEWSQKMRERSRFSSSMPLLHGVASCFDIRIRESQLILLLLLQFFYELFIIHLKRHTFYINEWLQRGGGGEGKERNDHHHSVNIPEFRSAYNGFEISHFQATRLEEEECSVVV